MNNLAKQKFLKFKPREQVVVPLARLAITCFLCLSYLNFNNLAKWKTTGGSSYTVR